MPGSGITAVAEVPRLATYARICPVFSGEDATCQLEVDSTAKDEHWLSLEIPCAYSYSLLLVVFFSWQTGGSFQQHDGGAQQYWNPQFTSDTASQYKGLFNGKVFTPHAQQDEVFAEFEPFLDNLVAGITGCIFAYGQTGIRRDQVVGTGKTYTVYGGAKYRERGLIPRLVCGLFQRLRRKREEAGSSSYSFSVSVKCLEVYNDQGYDLLAERADGGGATATSTTALKMDLFQSTPNLAERECATEREALDCVFLAALNRSDAKTKTNTNSSMAGPGAGKWVTNCRSHAIFTLIVTQYCPEEGTRTLSRLHLVDLAGSERVHKSASAGGGSTLTDEKQHEAGRLSEAKSINKSLHFLEQVVLGMQKHQSFLPFRNSLMTFLLREALVGNCRTALIATISALVRNAAESLSTIRFAQRCSKVASTPGAAAGSSSSSFFRPLPLSLRHLGFAEMGRPTDAMLDEEFGTVTALVTKLMEVAYKDVAPTAGGAASSSTPKNFGKKEKRYVRVSPGRAAAAWIENVMRASTETSTGGAIITDQHKEELLISSRAVRPSDSEAQNNKSSTKGGGAAGSSTSSRSGGAGVGGITISGGINTKPPAPRRLSGSAGGGDEAAYPADEDVELEATGFCLEKERRLLDQLQKNWYTARRTKNTDADHHRGAEGGKLQASCETVRSLKVHLTEMTLKKLAFDHASFLGVYQVVVALADYRNKTQTSGAANDLLLQEAAEDLSHCFSRKNVEESLLQPSAAGAEALPDFQPIIFLLGWMMQEQVRVVSQMPAEGGAPSSVDHPPAKSEDVLAEEVEECEPPTKLQKVKTSATRGKIRKLWLAEDDSFGFEHVGMEDAEERSRSEEPVQAQRSGQSAATTSTTPTLAMVAAESLTLILEYILAFPSRTGRGLPSSTLRWFAYAKEATWMLVSGLVLPDVRNKNGGNLHLRTASQRFDQDTLTGLWATLLKCGSTTCATATTERENLRLLLGKGRL
eukprot:g12156.t1